MWIRGSSLHSSHARSRTSRSQRTRGSAERRVGGQLPERYPFGEPRRDDRSSRQLDRVPVFLEDPHGSETDVGGEELLSVLLLGGLAPVDRCELTPTVGCWASRLKSAGTSASASPQRRPVRKYSSSSTRHRGSKRCLAMRLNRCRRSRGSADFRARDLDDANARDLDGLHSRKPADTPRTRPHPRRRLRRCLLRAFDSLTR